MITVEVTHDDIAEARTARNRSDYRVLAMCPVARAASRTLGTPVQWGFDVGWDKDYQNYRTIPAHRSKVRAWIDRFDGRERVGPFRFEMTEWTGLEDTFDGEG